MHFQLSFEEPLTHDMPGVVADKDHAQALRTFPDPRLVLGDLYELPHMEVNVGEGYHWPLPQPSSESGPEV